MKKTISLLKDGKLYDSITHIENLLKDDPKNSELRNLFIELLCINGELERADQQLDMVVKQNPDYLVGALNLRHLIRAEQSRQNFYQGAGTPKLFNEPDEQVETLLKLRLALKEQDQSLANEHANTLEKLRPAITYKFNGKAIDEFRDLDDSLCGFIELFGTDSHYYLAKLSEIESLTLTPPTTLTEQIWRKAKINIKDGPEGEVYLPLTYAASSTEPQKVGKETDWEALADNLVIGSGLKMFYVDGKAIAITEIEELQSIETVTA